MGKPSTNERSVQRISDKTDRSAGPLACNPWRGVVSQFGNPSLPIVNASGRKSSVSARRCFWESVHGPLPSTRRVRVTCGDLLCMNMAHMTIEPVKDPVPRFWKNVNKLPGDGCWEWMAARTHIGKGKNNKGQRGAGYGGFMVTALSRVQAHRYSWELHNGPIPEGLIIMHVCDNPPCVRPDHLRLGTYKENSQDAIAKGRSGPQRARAAGLRWVPRLGAVAIESAQTGSKSSDG